MRPSPQPLALSAASSSSRNSSSSSSPASSSTSSPPSTAISRLQQISKHIMSTPADSALRFPADIVPQAPEDPLFGLMAAYRADESSDKVDLGIGAYRDNNGKPWVLPVVKKVSNYQSPFFPNQSILGRRFQFSLLFGARAVEAFLHALLPRGGQLPSQSGRNRP
ncbi:uncharacterized protein SPSK_08030 [Sporothrix schenckii 1099-18]|uniref:Aspartate transaminase n=1 Tax=Sporothrix schenckii 1099-18 TaxID=1397361 RepID=A0A0F2MGJ2_SPOSC|nr:uncharacterized protein SPSK_08030 [Sporothrix schenckii 1099-18]KJR87945.1 hypothetical protein SPSK_08030 [Sporothrix schenckii 1099-18]